mmetsp:Transcript_18378/g.32544  ORF Transcript_18378/g.32544 Transcript_18378/m.32544 type:complete len:394 (+) Transcript_18378:2577-3758(+)
MERSSDEVNTLNGPNFVDLAKLSWVSERVLVRHVCRGTLRTQKDLRFALRCTRGVLYVKLISAVHATGENKTVRLTVHGFWSQGGCNHEHFALCQHFCNAWVRVQDSLGEFEHTKLNQGVLLRSYAFSRRPVVIRTGLLVLDVIDRGTTSKVDDASFLEACELPSNELVEKFVSGSCDETAAPIYVEAYHFEVFFPQRGKVVNPSLGLDKLGDLLISKAHGLHDIPLELGRPGLACSFGFFGLKFYCSRGRLNLSLLCRCSCFFGGNYWRTAILFNFIFNLVCCCADWHTGYMEPKWEQHVLALKLLVACHKVCLGHREHVSQVQATVHVWERKGNHIFFLARVRVRLEYLLLCPSRADSGFHRTEAVPARIVAASAAAVARISHCCFRCCSL